MVIYDKQFVLRSLVTMINDVMLDTIHKKFRYAGDDINSNLGEPSKSYIQGQFYIDDENRMYLSYILDPNTIWGINNDKAEDLYNQLNEYIRLKFKIGLLHDLHLEFLFPEDSRVKKPPLTSKCRVEETNRYLYDDTISYWKNIHGRLMFIRDSTILRADKLKVYQSTGETRFVDYENDISVLNSSYSFTIEESDIEVGFEEYKDIYNNYFGRELTKAEDSDIVKFYLINFTDYSIKEKKIWP